jgi:hypothetical protein
MKQIFFLLLLIPTACNLPGKKSNEKELKKLNELLPVANWQMIAGSDTSYIYFSPQENREYKTYEFKLPGGDSELTRLGSIYTSGDDVVWDFLNKQYVLKKITNNKIDWKRKDSTANLVLEKLNDSTLLINLPGKQFMLKKTLPLSTFLVRAKYDYLHGTRFRDSAEVKPRKLSGHN